MEHAEPASNIRVGAFWMIMAGLAFTAMLICIRYLAGRYPSVEVVFFRALIGLVFVIPPLMKHGVKGLHTKRFPMHISRAGFSLLAMVTYYYAVPYVPLANVTTYAFIIPLFVTLGAALVLKENVDLARWTATIVGFLGVLVVLRPGQAGIGMPELMMMLSVVFYAGSWISMKLLARTDDASVIVFYQNVLIVPLALVPTLIIGTMPTFEDFLFLIGVALFGSYAHYCQARSFGAADASAVMPFDFLRLVFSTVGGWYLFSETTDVLTWVGAVVIFGATYYISWHETRMKRKLAAS